MLSQLRTAVLMVILLTILTGGIYPLAVTAFAQIVFPHAANGSLMFAQPDNSGGGASGVQRVNRFDWSGGVMSSEVSGEMPIGSTLIGQAFSRPEYFWGRLSATSPQPYHAAASSGSNFGPSNPSLIAAAESRIAALQAHPTPTGKVPIDLVTSSGSGLDPHISPAAAEYQVARIAQARDMQPFAVRTLIRQHTEGRQWGVLGEPRVNVLRLNLELDRVQYEK